MDKILEDIRRVRSGEMSSLNISPEEMIEILGWHKTFEYAACVGNLDILRHIQKHIIDKYGLLIDKTKELMVYRALSCAVENKHKDVIEYIKNLWFYKPQNIREIAEKHSNYAVLKFI